MKATTAAPLVLVTRPEPAASRFAQELGDRLAGRGVRAGIRVAPLARISPVPLPRRLEIRPRAAILTSRNALPALERLVSRDVPVFAVGPGTAAAARQAGYESIAGPGTARQLAPLLQGHVSPREGPLLYLHGAPLAHDLARELTGLGYDVRAVLTYRQEPLPFDEDTRELLLAAGDAGQAVIVPVLSPMGAQNLADAWARAALPAEPAPHIVAFSPRIGAALERRGLAPALVLDTPRNEAMLAAIETLASRLGGLLR